VQVSPLTGLELSGSHDDPILRGFYLGEAQSADTIIAYVNSRPKNIWDEGNLLHYQFFRSMGYAVAAMDLRGFGQSRGKVNLEMAGDDFARLMSHLEQSFPDKVIIPYGVASATAGVVQYAGRRPHKRQPIILESPVFSPHEFAEYVMNSPKNRQKLTVDDDLHFNAKSDFQALRSPVLCLIGERDDQSLPKMQDAYFGAIDSECKTLVRHPLVQHANWPQQAPIALQQSMSDFFQKINQCK
jgi:pimeloyl-ACP methyl ester carboxylesterase